MDVACREVGFTRVLGHGNPTAVITGLAGAPDDLLALDLGVNPNFVDEFTNHSTDVPRMNNCALTPGTVDLDGDPIDKSEHTDFGIVAVLWADQVQGPVRCSAPTAARTMSASRMTCAAERSRTAEWRHHENLRRRDVYSAPTGLA